jgi:hypothetical protein
LAVAAAAGPAAAAPGWTARPTAAPAGAEVMLRSDPSSPCEWWMPAGDDGEMVRYDGTVVQVTLRDPGVRLIGTLPVQPGGGWSGRVRVPATITPGRYGLWVRCVVDHPDLEGRRSYDFDPLAFRVTDPAPATTTSLPPTTVPPTIPPPAPPPAPPVDVGPPPATVVAGVPTGPAAAPRPAARRPAAPRASAAARPSRPATLPNTGTDLRLALAGLGAVALGAAAIAAGSLPDRRPGPVSRDRFRG